MKERPLISNQIIGKLERWMSLIG